MPVLIDCTVLGFNILMNPRIQFMCDITKNNTAQCNKIIRRKAPYFSCSDNNDQ